MEESNSGFVLHGSSGIFQSRQHDIFGALDTAASEDALKRNGEPCDESERRSAHSRGSSFEKDERADFRPPRQPVPRRKSKPRFRSREEIRSSGRFTEYTLSDVKSSDLSETANARAAFSFLRSIRDAKRKEDNPREDGKQKLTFHKPEQKAPEAVAEPAKGRLSKHVMPEYVVGASKKRSVRNLSDNSIHVPDTESCAVAQKYDWDASEDVMQSPEKSADVTEKSSESNTFKKRKISRNVRCRRHSDSD